MCYIAPNPGQHPGAADTWQALLRHLTLHAGDFGIQRLSLCIPAQGDAAEIIAGSGFMLYVRETLFRLPASRLPRSNGPVANVRPQRQIDSIALQRLSDRYTPPVVQKAEGALVKQNGNSAHHLIFQNWWQPDRLEGLVYEADGDILAAVRIRRGRKGHWLHFLGDASQQDVMAALLSGALRHLQQDNLPVFCGVRAYQNALGAVLTQHGFQSATELARFVKHTTVRTREPVTSKTRLLVESTFPGVISTDATPKSGASSKS